MISTFNEPEQAQIVLEHLKHRGENQIAIKFPYDQELIKLVKQIKGTTWSSSNKCWFVLNSPDNLKAIFKAFKGKVWVNADALLNKSEKSKTTYKTDLTNLLNPKSKEALLKFKAYLEGKRYAQSTVNNYCSILVPFFHHFKHKDIDAIVLKDIEHYNYEFVVKRKYSVSYQRQLVNALKAFYLQRDGHELDLARLERPRKEKQLPDVLSEREVLQMIQVTKNLKHRCVIAFMYAAGLRMSELLDLKINDIDGDRKMIKVRNSKGRKDRYVPLSKILLPLLRNYYQTYKPKIYLFEGANGGRYTAVSTRKIIQRAAKEAGIKKRVYPHMLRHSYATHLMENGIDTRYVQELLGHQNIKTTMIYTHVRSRKLEEINSPLDAAINKIMGNDKEHSTLEKGADTLPPEGDIEHIM